jgi:multiple antibiotic resistance protein
MVCGIVYLCYCYARAAERVLGKTGTEVVMRLSSFILLCIGIQIMCSGGRGYLATVHA